MTINTKIIYPLSYPNRLVLLASFCFFTLAANAQSFRHHEFSSTFGFGPNMADKEVSHVKDCYDMQYQGECFDLFGESLVTFNLEYHYRFDRHWAAGAIIGWGSSEDSYYRCDGIQTSVRGSDDCFIQNSGDISSKVFYLAPSAKYNWFLKGKFRLYSRVALGAMRQHTTFDYIKTKESFDEVKWKVAYQLTPIGFDFGIEPIRVYSELGYGCQGLFTIGARVAL